MVYLMLHERSADKEIDWVLFRDGHFELLNWYSSFVLFVEGFSAAFCGDLTHFACICASLDTLRFLGIYFLFDFETDLSFFVTLLLATLVDSIRLSFNTFIGFFEWLITFCLLFVLLDFEAYLD